MSATRACPGTAPSESPVRLNRTCTACRLRKVKCTPLAQEQDAETVNVCTRCWKHSLSCVFPPAARKKTRRRNEEKLRDLESRLVAVQAVLDSGPRRQGLTDRDTTSSLPVINEISLQGNVVETLDVPAGDPVTKSLVSPELAKKLCQTFSNDLAPLYPLVTVPRSSTWKSLRIDRPALFRAIITAASTSAQPTVSANMFRETSQFLAEKVVVAGEKSLDLVQALLVLSTWHLPPGTFMELKFSQYAHMAATMVTDLRSSNDKRYATLIPSEASQCSDELVEICRTFLAVYFLCSSMAMSYRRPTSLPYGSWVEDCVRVLEHAPGLCQNDRRLVEWVKLQRITEESLSAASLDGNSSVDVSDTRTRFILRGCMEKLEAWSRSVPEDIFNSTMEMHYQTILITIHEPALYDEHDISDFRPPYALRLPPQSKQNQVDIEIHAASSLMPCIMSSQALMRTFLGLPIETLLFMPVVTYTRVTYAAIVLIKCFVSARAHACFDELHPETSLSPVSAVSQLLDKLHLVKDQAQGRIPVPAVFHSILSAVYRWCVRVFAMEARWNVEDVMEPMLHLSLENDKSVGYAEMIGEFPGSTAHPASTEDQFHWNELDPMGDIQFDASVIGSFPEFPYFLNYMDQSFR